MFWNFYPKFENGDVRGRWAHWSFIKYCVKWLTMSEDLKNVIYNHDNAPAHMAAAADLKIALLGFYRLSHPPYSQALTPLDFAHFPMLKSNLQAICLTCYKPLTDPSVVIGSKMCSNNGSEGMGSELNTQTDNLKSCDNVTLQVRVDIHWAACL